VLTDAAIRGAKDDLLGLKENIIIGHLIRRGRGSTVTTTSRSSRRGLHAAAAPAPVTGEVPSPFPEEVEAD